MGSSGRSSSGGGASSAPWPPSLPAVGDLLGPPDTVSYAGSSNQTHAAGVAAFALIYVPADMPMDALCVQIDVGDVGSTVRAGLFSLDGNGRPVTRVAEAVIAGDSVGRGVGTTSRIVLPAGSYASMAYTASTVIRLRGVVPASHAVAVPGTVPNSNTWLGANFGDSTALLAAVSSYALDTVSNVPLVTVRRAA